MFINVLLTYLPSLIYKSLKHTQLHTDGQRYLTLLWPPCRAGHYILQLWFLSSSFFLISSPILSGRRLDVYHTSRHNNLSANLECMSEMCCTRLAENTGRKNYAKKSPSVYHRTIYPGISSQLRHVSTIGKMLNSNISSTRPHNMVNVDSLTAEIGWRVWGTPANFNGFRVLASLLHRCRSTEANQALHDVWPSPGLVHYVYIFGGSCP